jgi:hypothetical protein
MKIFGNFFIWLLALNLNALILYHKNFLKSRLLIMKILESFFIKCLALSTFYSNIIPKFLKKVKRKTLKTLSHRQDTENVFLRKILDKRALLWYHTYIHTYGFMYIRLYLNAALHPCVFMVLCIYVYTYIRTYVYMVLCIYVFMVVDRTESVFLRKLLDMKTFSRYPRQDITL